MRYILYLSRIHPKKGCDLLVDAFASVADANPDLFLIVAGPDQTGWVKTLQDQASHLGVADRILWPGILQGDAKWGAYYGCEAFILPSHQENFGIVVAEALACGKPVLITDKVNIWREISAAKAGLVAPDTSEGVKQLLQQWLSLSPEERAAMGDAARRCFEERFDFAATSKSILELYDDLTRNRHS
jgi:glycosyltransferase involved in cell wall biosynthesis